MENNLLTYARDYNVPFIKSITCPSRSYSESSIFFLMKKFYQSYGMALVLYGGQTATEDIFGFRKMRDLTNDIDYVMQETVIADIIKNENISYCPEYDIFFAYQEEIPITFTFQHIHDWQVSYDFFTTAQVVSFNDGQLYCCSPEYTIMLKFRRSLYCMKSKRCVFGKDCIDIINLLMAPLYRSDLNKLDFDRLLDLLKTHVTSNTQELLKILEYIYKYKQHLPEKNLLDFEKVYNAFEERVTEL